MNLNTLPGMVCASADCVESHCDVRGSTLTVKSSFVAMTGGILPIPFTANDRLKDIGSASSYINLGRTDADGDGDTETIYVIGDRAYAYLGD